ncbi:hypothetical protein ACHAWF_007495 [Thalassiosira exigua]
MTRQIEHATLFYRLSFHGKTATTLNPDEAAAMTSKLTPSDLEVIPNNEARPNISVHESWRVSDDEYVIKVDTSPLHMSAAQRLFGGKMKKHAAPSSAITEKDVDDFVAIIDDAPLPRRSVAQRMFGGVAAPNKPNEEREEETREEEEGAREEEAVAEESVQADPPSLHIDETRALSGKEKAHKEKANEKETRDLDLEWESQRNLGLEWTYFWNNVFHRHSNKNQA